MVKCDKAPLPPLTVTMYKPTEPLQDTVEVPRVPSVTLPGLSVQLNPFDGETDAVSTTVPAKLLRLVTVMVAVPAVPPLNVTVAGLAATAKS